MTDNDFDHVRDVLNGICAVFNEKMPPLRLKFYWESLNELSLDQFNYCTKQIMKSAEFMPKPSAWFKARTASWK